ncbi:MAG: hypothetical protein AB1744_13295, partial [Candidatus Zixiibacteriota bacterium]
MSENYSSHADYMSRVVAEADKRRETVEQNLRSAFEAFIQEQQVEVVLFSNMSVLDLARAIELYPVILKSLLACCNVAARAIERDLSIKNVDTYNPRLTMSEAS